MFDYVGFGTVIALLQPWAIVAYNKWINGTLSIFPADHIELNSGRSTIVVVRGVMQARNKNMFVRNIELSITRLKDSAQRRFRWLAFRSMQFPFPGHQLPASEIPTSFLVHTDSPHKFNIVFYDFDGAAEITPIMRDYDNAWFTLQGELRAKGFLDSEVFNDPRLKPIMKSEALYSEIKNRIDLFIKSDIYEKASTLLNDNFFWTAGDYYAKMIANCDNKRMSAEAEFVFKLTDSESKHLRNNLLIELLAQINALLNSSEAHLPIPYTVSIVDKRSVTTTQAG